MAKLAAICERHHPRRMIGKSGQHRHLMPILYPETRHLRNSTRGCAHFWWKILRYVENVHEVLVIRQLECALVKQRARARGAAARVPLPFIRVEREDFIPSDAMHDAQLYHMQSVIERAGNHGQQRAGLLVERPETQVISRKIFAKRKRRLRK